MSRKKQNNDHFTDEYFAELDSWTRNEERKTATKKRISNSIGKKRASYRPYLISFATAIVFTIISLSVLTDFFVEKEETTMNSETIEMHRKDFFRTSKQDEKVWIATINSIPTIIHYEDMEEKQSGEVTIYYEKMGEDLLSMAFHLDGTTYTIIYNLSYEKNIEDALRFAEDTINEYRKR